LKTWKDLSWDFFEGLFFVCIVMEILIVPIGVVVGWTDGDVVHWFLWTVNAAVFVTLTGIWIEVKKIYEKVAAVLLATGAPAPAANTTESGQSVQTAG
jgi:hypothetical protein